MVGTILPIVYGERAQGQRCTSLWIHMGGYVLGSILTGATVGALGAAVRSIGGPPWTYALTLAGIAAVALSLRELGLVRLPLPELSRQVPAGWRFRLPPRLLAFSYGVELGSGVTTFIPVSTFYVVITGILLIGSPLTGAAVMAAYGIGRGLPVMAIGWTTNSVSENFEMVRNLTGWKPLVHMINGLLLALIGTALLAGPATFQ